MSLAEKFSKKVPVQRSGLQEGYIAQFAHSQQVALHEARNLHLNEARSSFSFTKELALGYAQRQTLTQYTKGAFSLSNALLSIYTQCSTSRQNYWKLFTELYKQPIVKAILRQIKGDVLNANPRGEIFRFVAARDDVQKELDELTTVFDFNMMLKDISRDLINLGEYAIRIKCEEGKGLVAYYADVDVSNFLAFYEQGWPVRYLIYKERDAMIYPATDYVHFCVTSDKLRFKLDNPSGITNINSDVYIPALDKRADAMKDDLPDFVQVGEPLFYAHISKIRELIILEYLMPALKLNQITMPQIASLAMPANTPTQDALAACYQYENALNTPIGLDLDNNSITIADIMTVAGRIKVLPNFADGKGALAGVTVRENHSIDDVLAATKDLRANILSSMGIPASLIYGGEPNKVAELRTFGRYTRMLAEIQFGIARGLKHVALVHLLNKGFQVHPGDIDVEFVESLVDLSGLEKLEFDDAKQEILMRKIDFADRLSESVLIAPYLNHRNVAQWLKNSFDILTGDVSLFNVDEEGLLLNVDADEVETASRVAMMIKVNKQRDDARDSLRPPSVIQSADDAKQHNQERDSARAAISGDPETVDDATVHNDARDDARDVARGLAYLARKQNQRKGLLRRQAMNQAKLLDVE